MSKPKAPCVINATPSHIKRGDIGYARTNGLLGLLIRVGEKLKWRNGDANHAFVVVTEGDSYDKIWIVQATLKGVVRSRLSELMATSTRIETYPPPTIAHPQLVALFAEYQIGDPYGLLSDICLAVDILTPVWFWSVRRNGTWICSALAAEAMRFAGWYFDFPDVYGVAPTPLKEAHLSCLP